MKVKLSGTVYYANGDPVSDVSVRIYDKDAEGKQDDDLTVSPGISDERGRFTLTYEPLRYLDFHAIDKTGSPDEPFNTPNTRSGLRLPDLGDIYLPYLKFNYTFNGLIRTHDASLGLFQKKFYLPENPPVEFRPSTHGFKFTNSFSGYFLPFSTPAFMGSKKVTSKYGLCGGMCSAAYDFALASREVPVRSTTPRQGTRLHRYLFRRQMDSLGGLGRQIIKVAQWTSMPDDTLVGTQSRTMTEFEQVKSKLDDNNLVILALIYERASTLRELSRLIFNNHQVLAYAYQIAPAGLITIHIYDPNLPDRDDVVIQCEPILLGVADSPAGPQNVKGLKSTQFAGGEVYKNVRGFFPMPYEPVAPPKRLR